MARRTIRARRASPYLLYLVIAFSILMVVAAIWGAWMYSIKNQTELNAFGPQRLADAKANEADLWRQVFDKYQGDGANLLDIIEAKERVADEYRTEIHRLTERLAGDPYTTQQKQQLRQSVSDILKASSDTLAQASAVLQRSYQVGSQQAGEVQMTHMSAAILALMQRIAALVDQVKADNASVATLDNQIKGLQEELAAAKAEHARQVAQLQANLDDEKARLTQARDDSVAQATRTKEELQRLTDEFIARQRQAAADHKKLQTDAMTLQNNLKDLGEELVKFRRVPTETGVDGRIISTAEKGSVAYGDLGRKDGVLLGMTFSVFSPNDLGRPDPQPKAHCRIVRIMDNSCELRIYALQGDNPVVTGDVLHNPVYDRQRRLRFVLVGKMDIDGDGTDDVEQLKGLIQEFGGRLDASLTVQTDYLVLGEKPKILSAPAPGAGPMERQMYEENRKAFIEFTDAEAKAENFSIPILSLNRFLGLVGIAGAP